MNSFQGSLRGSTGDHSFSTSRNGYGYESLGRGRDEENPTTAADRENDENDNHNEASDRLAPPRPRTHSASSSRRSDISGGGSHGERNEEDASFAARVRRKKDKYRRQANADSLNPPKPPFASSSSRPVTPSAFSVSSSDFSTDEENDGRALNKPTKRSRLAKKVPPPFAPKSPTTAFATSKTSKSSTSRTARSFKRAQTFHQSLRRKISLSTETWYYELISLSLSLTAFASAILLLSFQDGRPAGEWRFGAGVGGNGAGTISLNTVIAVLGAVSRASLAFAVGGALGQGKWNWFTRKGRGRGGNPEGGTRGTEGISTGTYDYEEEVSLKRGGGAEGEKGIMMVGDRLDRFDKFEEASRGPWGSVRLLGSLWWTHWTSLGALAMIIMLGFEAFLQAIVSYEGQLRLVDVSISGGDDESTAASAFAGAYLHRSERLDSGFYQPCLDSSCPAALSLPVNSSSTTTTTTRSTDNDTDADGLIRDAISIPSWGSYPHVSIMSAFYKGLSQDTSNTVSSTYTCPTGNCTFPPYTSLGFCSQCNDISSSIVPTVLTNTSSNESYSVYSLPYVSLSDKTKDLTVAHGVLDPWRTVSMTNLSTMLMAFGVISRDADTDASPVGTECALYLCAGLYETSVKNGVVAESKTASWGGSNDGEREDESWEILDPRDTENIPSGWKFPDVTDWTPILGWYDEGEKDAIDKWDLETNRSLAQLENNFLRSDLQIVIPPADVERYGLGGAGRTTTRFNFSQATVASTLTWLGNGMANPAVFYNIRNGSYGRTTDLAYWEAGNYTARFERLATTLSAWARKEVTSSSSSSSSWSSSSTSESSTPAAAAVVQGSMYQWTLITRVNWAFLTLPGLAMLLGVTFFGLTVLEARDLGLRPWKGSTLATLAMGLDEGSRRRLREMAAADGGGFDEAGRSIRVFFCDGSGNGDGDADADADGGAGDGGSRREKLGLGGLRGVGPAPCAA
ncbi:hypothetical protein MKZ38_007727 [Zalerion maritima]|uniref:Uncharacterized protein n=1 Tax=Zalerion maritima TaxID=339359 RepID=A0AAD5RIJ5_9PEZI|nr:hypothetical protein MKZ38_007727 [Zalerion maritima]